MRIRLLRVKIEHNLASSPRTETKLNANWPTGALKSGIGAIQRRECLINDAMCCSVVRQQARSAACANQSGANVSPMMMHPVV